jgi:hypothetical protein
VKNAIGQKIGEFYKDLSFDPNPEWLQNAGEIRKEIGDSIQDPAMRQDWNEVFKDAAMRPAFGGEKDVPVSGEHLQQLVSKLGDEANRYGMLAQKSPANRAVYAKMADGLRNMQKSIYDQVEAGNPDLTRRRMALNNGYFLADVVADAAKASKSGIATPAQFISSWEDKLGTQLYGTGTRLNAVKNRLEAAATEHAAGAPSGKAVLTPHPKAPTTAPEELRSRVGELIRRAFLTGTGVGGFKLGGMIGHPWAGASLGHVAGQAALDPLEAGGRALVRRPGALGMLAGQAAPPLVTDDNQ